MFPALGAAPQPGSVFDHYRLLEKLGEGGMGVVYLAEDTRLGRKVAIKFLPPGTAGDPVRRQRFEQEARAAAALSHPGIATVHELAETHGQIYIVFEYVPGRTLRCLVVPGGLQREELLDIACDIADAIAAAHTAGVVHRDLKPENVIRTPAGNCKVLDFGLARLTPEVPSDSAAETSSHLTSAGMIVGTIGYMAPEQLQGKKDVDFRCDIFSFGTLLYELATGVHPFQSGNPVSTMAAVLTAEPPPLTQRNSLQPAELERIARKCLRKRREERYQSTLDLAVDLRNLKQDSGESRSSVAAIAAPVPPADDDSLFRKISASFGLTPRRWWEMHQLFMIFLYTPLALHLGLRSAAMLSAIMNIRVTSAWHGWQATIRDILSDSGHALAIWRNFGLALLMTLVLLLTVGLAIRLYLVCLAAFIPGRLPAEVRKFQPALRAIYVIVSGQFAFVGVLLLRAGELIWGAGLAVLGLTSLLAAAYVEPVMARAAFPQAFTVDQRQRARQALVYRIAAAHAVYALLLFLPVGAGNVPLDAVMGFSLSSSPGQLAVSGYSLVMGLGIFALFINGLQIVRETHDGLRVFLGWFPAYLAIDLAGIACWIWMAFHSRIPAPVVVGITAGALVLPFGQRRMAEQVLRDSGESSEAPRSRIDLQDH